MSTLRLAASEQDKMDVPCLSDNCYSLFPPLAELGLGWAVGDLRFGIYGRLGAWIQIIAIWSGYPMHRLDRSV